MDGDPLRSRAIIVGMVMLLLLSSILVISDDGDGATTSNVKVMYGDGTENGTETYNGSGSSLKTIITETMGKNGHDIKVNNNGTVKSVDGKANSDSHSWVVFQWRPPTGWTYTYLNNSGDSFLKDGTSYYIYYSLSSIKDGKTAYSTPTVKPTGTAYFFIKFVEDVNANSYVTSVLTEQQRLAGFWVSGTGSNMAEAFQDACSRYSFELNMSDGVKDGIVDLDYVGWLFSFLGLGDESEFAGSTGVEWKYWSQFYWDDSVNEWIYSETMGHYDPSVTPYFALVRQITTTENAKWNHGQTPPDVPKAQMTNGCKVTFVDGDGNVIDTKTATYFGGVTAPSSATKSPSGGKTYTFAGWEGNYSQVISDTTIKAKFSEKSSGDTGKKVTSVSIVRGNTTFKTGEIAQFSATVSPSDATNKQLIWSTSDDGIATIDGDGRMVAKKEGVVTVTVTTVDGGYKDSVSVTITSSSIPVNGISITNTISLVEIDLSLHLEAEITPSNATNKNVTWESSDPNIATVSKDGTVIGKSVGSVTISVTTVDGGYKDSVSITVVSPTPRSVHIVDGNRALKVGDQYTLEAIVMPENAGNRTVKWSSGDETIATVDEDGKVTALKAGTVKIIATTAEGGLKAECVFAIYSDDDISKISNNEVEIVDDRDASFHLNADAKDKLVGSDSGYTLTITGNGSITLSVDILKNASEGGFTLSFKKIVDDDLTDVQKSVIGDRQVYDYSIDGLKTGVLGGKATITMKYTLKTGEKADDLRIYHIDGEGKLEEFDCSYDSKNGEVTFETTHFSMYFVASEDLIGSDSPSSDNTMMIVAAVIGVVIVIGVIGFIVFRRNH